eukprot:Colp12_sorted_trinity150504_noHs@34034
MSSVLQRFIPCGKVDMLKRSIALTFTLMTAILTVALLFTSTTTWSLCEPLANRSLAHVTTTVAASQGPTQTGGGPFVSNHLQQTPVSHQTEVKCKQECEHLFHPHQNATSCKAFYVPVRLTTAGLGHRISEMTFFLKQARIQKRCLVYEPFLETECAFPHGETYSWVEKEFGLGTGLHNVGACKKKDLPSGADIKEGGYTSCLNGNCFYDPDNALALDNTRLCFSCIARMYGRLQKIDNQVRNNRPITIIWHVRVGDIELHPPTDPFYAKLWSTLATALARLEYPARNVVIGTDQRNNYIEGLSKVLPNVTFSDPSTREAITAMMNADIIVSSGSSFSLVPMLFSYKPFYLNHVPKHGFHHGQDYIVEGSAWLDKDGSIGMHPFPFYLELRKHLAKHHNEDYIFEGR